jgi:hypothetical protein
MKHFFFVLSASALLLVPVVSTRAQTGPGNDIQQFKSMPPAPKSIQSGMTPDRLATILQQQGAQTEIKRNQDGSTTVHTIMKKGTWTFVLNLYFTADGKSLDLICPLGNPTQQFSNAQLLAVLRQNGKLPVNTYFYYNDADQRLTLNAPNFSTATLTDQAALRAINALCTHAQNTHNVWNPNLWQNAGGPAPAAMIQP